MAEALLEQMCPKPLEAYSAGIEPEKLNPFVVEILQSGRPFAWVATVCGVRELS